MRIKLLQKFLRLEASSGIILFLATMAAITWANSPFSAIYQKVTQLSSFWINEGLMAVFFLLVGLELKRGFVEENLARLSHVLLPAIAALGGMIAPALLYTFFNFHHPFAVKGWAIPVATDIAFAIGVLSCFGRRVPVALKLFLLALAIFDDIGAIIIIVLFYSHGLAYLWLFQAAVLVFILYLFNKLSIQPLFPYLVIGIWLWLCLLHSGIHPTLTGIIVALAIPFSSGRRLEETLHPWVAYLIMPLFALANAGFSFQGLSFQLLTDTVVLGITFGLFIGKQIGVFGFSWLLIKSRFAKRPYNTSWLDLYGVAILCGIGFTMSLFLGTLSFQNADLYLAEMRLGVLLGSVLSGLVGSLVLLVSFRNRSTILG
ncbi:MAG: Na+/H+ antiporter NhaA [Gammaproteobacteria bacterium]|nr:MAG: Na+/H+ antiporter NhaA [Gammaproteobacteria bacterium]